MPARARDGSLVRLLASLLIFLAACMQVAQKEQPGQQWGPRVADAYLLRSAGEPGQAGRKWNYEEGLVLHALIGLGTATGDTTYFAFAQRGLDAYVDDRGGIRSYKPGDFNLDNIAGGRALLEMYAATRAEKYRRAADTLQGQLRDQPRTAEGGFWHKQIYPYQMWLDGLYMAEPFRAQYASMFNRPSDFDDIINQFVWIAGHVRDEKTGLMYHGWDERRQERWADRTTGCSPNFWGRAMGWFAMGLVDVLEYVPREHPRRQELVRILQGLADALVKYQDAETGLWYQVVDKPGRPGNYLETSASCMFAYAFARAAARGDVPEKFVTASRAAYAGLVRHRLTVREDGSVDLLGTCRVAGLGGNPYRDGSYDYYCNEPQATNDLKGIGAFLLAATEFEQGRPGIPGQRNESRSKR